MDSTKKYILMCEKAEEIQKKWKPAFNDFAYEKDDLYDHADRIKSVNSCCDDEYSGTGDSIHYNNAKEDCIWLPRQDQLQEMLNRSLPKLVWGFEEFTERMTDTDCFKDKSMEQLWLAFVMKEKYNKTWDGEKWIKGA